MKLKERQQAPVNKYNNTVNSTNNTSLDNLTHAANIILNKDRKHATDEYIEKSHDQFNNNNQKNLSFSLSNLSAAASAEFEYLQCNYDSKHDYKPDIYQRGSALQDSSKKKKFQQKNNNRNSAKKLKTESTTNEDYSYSNISSNSTFEYQSVFEDKINMADDINTKFNVLDKKSFNLQGSVDSSKANSLVGINGNNGLSKSDDFNSNKSNSNGVETTQSCADCGKVFTNKSALAKHRLIHRLVFV